jgi:hypothetical protein
MPSSGLLSHVAFVVLTRATHPNIQECGILHTKLKVTDLEASLETSEGVFKLRKIVMKIRMWTPLRH